MKNVSIEIYTDEKECEKIWRNYSRNETLWDLWQIRKIIAELFELRWHFVVAKKGSDILGALPLCYNPAEKRLEWVGAGWAEGNYSFGDSTEVTRMMLNSLKEDIYLDAIFEKDAWLFGTDLKPDSDHFGIDLRKVDGDWEGFLKSLSGKKRYNIKRDVKSIEARNPVVLYNRASDLEVMFDLNINRMREKSIRYSDEERSVYEEGNLDKEFISRLWKNRGNGYDARIICVEIDGRPVSCDFTLMSKSKYYSLHGGVDVKAASGVGSFSNKLIIDDAVALDCDYVDFCMEDHHWKSSWFEADPVVRYEK